MRARTKIFFSLVQIFVLEEKRKDVMYDLTGKTVLVTGAAKRIGNAISIGLARKGSNVIVHYGKSEIEAEKLRHRITEMGVRSWLLKADFSNLESYKELIEEACQKAGKIDILVNNASIFSVNPINKTNLKEINENLLINSWTPFLLSRYFSEKTSLNKIVNLLDTRISGFDLNHFAYYLSKKMLGVLTSSMALELAPNITVNGVAPGLILPPEGKDYTYLEKKKDAVPLKKYGSVSDIVETVLFLLQSDFITGQVIYVDGGVHLKRIIEGL